MCLRGSMNSARQAELDGLRFTTYVDRSLLDQRFELLWRKSLSACPGVPIPSGPPIPLALSGSAYPSPSTRTTTVGLDDSDAVEVGRDGSVELQAVGSPTVTANRSRTVDSEGMDGRKARVNVTGKMGATVVPVGRVEFQAVPGGRCRHGRRGRHAELAGGWNSRLERRPMSASASLDGTKVIRWTTSQRGGRRHPRTRA